MRTTGEGLIAEGDALEELARASETDIPAANAAVLREGGERLVDAGRRTRTAGELLRSVGEQHMRGVGR